MMESYPSSFGHVNASSPPGTVRIAVGSRRIRTRHGLKEVAYPVLLKNKRRGET
jgi:hypothetical protein